VSKNVVTVVRESLDEAKQDAATFVGKTPKGKDRRKVVYVAQSGDTRVYLAALNAGQAAATAARHFGIQLSPAEPATRGPVRRKTMEEQIERIGVEDPEKLKALKAKIDALLKSQKSGSTK
jgi:hypothetical protein